MRLPAGKLTETPLSGARLFAVGMLGLCLLGGCSPSGKADSKALLGSFAEVPVVPGPEAPTLPSSASLQSYAAADSPTPATGGGLASLFGAFRAEPAPLPEPPPPGEFIAPEIAPLPALRPEYGDRPKVDLVALAKAEAERLAQASASNPERSQAMARSLDAYERREAGLPQDDEEDDDELDQLAVTAPEAQTNGAQPNAAQAGSAAEKMAFSYTQAHFEISGVQPSPLSGAAAPGASARSSNGLAINAPAQRWRAAYDNVETACFPQQLRNALNNIGAHFKGEVLVTSGARKTGRRGSLHRSCKAADIRIAGVDPADVAAYARTVPGLNGVGTYRRVSLTHIDVRDERFAWRW